MADRTNSFYALSESIQGYGAQIMVGDGGSPETFEAIAAVNSITPGEASTADIDRTHLRSIGAHREHAAGMLDHGEFTITGTYLPGEQSLSQSGGGDGAFASGGLPKLWQGRAAHNFKLVLNDGSPATALPFNAYVSKFQIGAIEPDGKIDYTAAFMPTRHYDHP